MKLLRLVVCTSSFHIGASITLARLLQCKEFSVVGILHHEVISPNKKSIKRVKKMIERSGMVFLLQTVFVQVLQKIGIFLFRIFLPWKRRKLFDVDELAKKYDIPLYITDDVNSPESYAFAESKKPDILVSCYLLQILKPKMLHIPPQGAVNIHPALLPKFAGSWTSFWVLYHNEKRAGATAHYMNEHLDSGDIILQKSFRISKKRNSFCCLTKKVAYFSAEVLVKALRRIKEKNVRPRPICRPKKLFRMPNKYEIKRSRERFRFVHLHKLIHWF
jgi:folate-dependent phosphoribosylglycinamide formyltransferase PurN